MELLSVVPSETTQYHSISQEDHFWNNIFSINFAFFPTRSKFTRHKTPISYDGMVGHGKHFDPLVFPGIGCEISWCFASLGNITVKPRNTLTPQSPLLFLENQESRPKDLAQLKRDFPNLEISMWISFWYYAVILAFTSSMVNHYFTLWTGTILSLLDLCGWGPG